MSGKIFVDTNILVYAVADDQHKREIAEETLLNNEVVISPQVINEFIAVTLRKKILQPTKVPTYARQFMQAFEVTVMSTSTISLALDMMAKYHFSYWDSLILAAALENNCPILYSEDLQNNQRIENKLTIHNPFKL